MGATDSVIVSTCGRAVVPDTSISHPISTVEFIPTRVLVISESSRVLNIFSIPDAGDNLLHPRYDQCVPGHRNGEFDHRRHFDAPVVTSPLFSMLE